jgi:hypothetical protein
MPYENILPQNIMQPPSCGNHPQTKLLHGGPIVNDPVFIKPDEEQEM